MNEMKGKPSAKRHMKQANQKDPFANKEGTGPIHHKHGTKPERKAHKHVEEMKRKHSKADLSAAHVHMKKHGG